MPKLPTLNWKPAPPGGAERLAHWLELWRLEQDLRRENPDYAAAFKPNPRDKWASEGKLVYLATRHPFKDKTDHPFDEALKIGQIRLLDPRMFAEVRRARYVAVIAGWGDDAYLAAPFGPFEVPATTTEWITGIPTSALSVLCLWNTRTLPSAILKRSWLVGELSLEQLADAWAVFRHAMTGVELDDRLLALVGCSITHPRDPRRLYQAEELGFFAFHGSEQNLPPNDSVDVIHDPEDVILHRRSTQLASLSPPSPPSRNISAPPSWNGRENMPADFRKFIASAQNLPEEQSLSAHTASGKRYALRWIVKGRGVSLLISQTSVPTRMRVSVGDNLTARPSESLDGSTLISTTGEKILTVKGAEAETDTASLRDRFILFSKEGIPLELEEVLQ